MTVPAHPGYEAEPTEVKALLDGLLDEEAWGNDPTTWYIELAKVRALLDAASLECTRRASAAVAELNQDMSYDQIAAHLGLSKPRVQQLVKLAKAS